METDEIRPFVSLFCLVAYMQLAVSRKHISNPFLYSYTTVIANFTVIRTVRLFRV